MIIVCVETSNMETHSFQSTLRVAMLGTVALPPLCGGAVAFCYHWKPMWLARCGEPLLFLASAAPVVSAVACVAVRSVSRACVACVCRVRSCVLGVGLVWVPLPYPTLYVISTAS